MDADADEEEEDADDENVLTTLGRPQPWLAVLLLSPHPLLSSRKYVLLPVLI